MDEREGTAGPVLRLRGVARVHGLAVDAHVRVDVVGEEAARRPALLRPLEVAERAVVVEVAAVERPELAGLRVDRIVEDGAGLARAEVEELTVAARARTAAGDGAVRSATAIQGAARMVELIADCG